MLINMCTWRILVSPATILLSLVLSQYWNLSRKHGFRYHEGKNCISLTWEFRIQSWEWCHIWLICVPVPIYNTLENQDGCADENPCFAIVVSIVKLLLADLALTVVCPKEKQHIYIPVEVATILLCDRMRWQTVKYAALFHCLRNHLGLWTWDDPVFHEWVLHVAPFCCPLTWAPHEANWDLWD